ncbi:hypothetical protein HDF22_001536 [Mucilaginibacter lappiensis]|uniref:Uncharacterized protein n=1 Tax=Mucilaginibacter lappiensis TaxID=354630 RepID=A0A841JFJ6_9SPHI|nr:hypothetical protein [Mucilaginibacter lappiensis]
MAIVRNKIIRLYFNDPYPYNDEMITEAFICQFNTTDIVQLIFIFSRIEKF